MKIVFDPNQPFFFDEGNPADRKKMAELKKQGEILEVVDQKDDQLKEWQLVRSPRLLKQPPNKKLSRLAAIPDWTWVYYPWRRILVRCLSEKYFKQLRLSRNQNFITTSEQNKFARFKVALAGLSVGNPAAICLALEGGAERMKLADNDTLSLSNFNRFRASLTDLGQSKAVLSARQIYEINPFAKLEVFTEGLTEENLDKFLNRPKADVLIEEMDNLLLKILVREKARQYRLPVLMVTGNGAGVILDVERFDLKHDLPLLNGYLRPAIIKKIKKGVTSFEEKIALARDFMGQRFLTARLRQSFAVVGQKLAGIPQLAEASFLRGAVLCYAVRQLALGQDLPSGRHFLRLEDML